MKVCMSHNPNNDLLQTIIGKSYFKYNANCRATNLQAREAKFLTTLCPAHVMT